MVIGGFQMEDVGYGIKITEHESGWSFWLQGDDAQLFRDDWKDAEDVGVNFRHFLRYYDYTAMLS